MSEPKKSYYAIIPASVRYDSELIPNAKLLYGELTALCNEKGFCWAGDKYFCDLYKVDRTTVQRWFKSLENGGYIYREVKYKEGTREIEHRYTYLCDKGIRKNATTPIRKNATDNNTSFNNTNNIVDSNESKKKSLIELESDFNKLWSLYPNKQGKKKAFSSYQKAIKEGTTNKEIQDGIIKYKKHLANNDWLKPANGSTWFNNERWNDEYESAIQKKSKKDWESELIELNGH